MRNLVVGSNLRFADAGNHELKGVPGEWHLFRVAEAVSGNGFAQLGTLPGSFGD